MLTMCISISLYVTSNIYIYEICYLNENINYMTQNGDFELERMR